MNCVANSEIVRSSGFNKVYIPPAPHDGGTAVGCAVYGLGAVTGKMPAVSWKTDFLGPCPDLSVVEDLLRACKCCYSCPDNLSDKCAEAIASGSVVALYQGSSELGPRALGHRSILADPRRIGLREHINKNIKGRELFRPLAPVVMEEDARRYFDDIQPLSAFMQFAAAVRESRRHEIPAVTHVDGTARLQTLSRDQDPFLFDILHAFRCRTGIGVLLNTSLNEKDKPIVENPNDAIDFFLTSQIDVLVIPPFIVQKST